MQFLISILACFAPPMDSSSVLLDIKTLESLPHVESVQVTPAKGNRKRQIIHILDYHFVDEKSHGIDIRDAAKRAGETLTDAEVAEDWEDFIGDVKAVQLEQVAVLRTLAKSQGLKAVYMEGLGKEDLPAYRKRIELLRDWKKPPFDSALAELLIEIHRNDVLRFGAAGQLAMVNELAVLPVEDKKLYEAANPLKDGTVKFDEAAIERREDAIVRNLLASESPVTMLILGGDHDLADNVPEGVEVLRVKVEAYQKAVE